MKRSKALFQNLCAVAYYGIAQHLPRSTAPGGRLWKMMRGCVARGMLASAGRGINVESLAYIGKGSGIRVGENSGIGYRCYLQGNITIGNDVMMAPEVIILTGSHRYDRTDIPMSKQGSFDRPVIIEDDVWIGTRAIILPGVRIGKGSIIGCAAVVTSDVSPFSIVGGIPARVIGKRAPQTAENLKGDE